MCCPKRSPVDELPGTGQTAAVYRLPSPALSVAVQRRRSKLEVAARSKHTEPSWAVEVTYSGGPDGVWFRFTRNGQVRVFARDEVARHPAVSAVLRLIADEVDLSTSSSESLLEFLFRSLIVYVERISTPVPLPKWGRPLRDRHIERALELLNADIAKRWTVELLARAVGLSRPVFARRFVHVLGLSPMRYLTEKRLRLAAALLFDSEATLSEVANRVGYRSEFAFSRAFKRHHRVPPGVYRHRPVTALRAVPPIAA